MLRSDSKGDPSERAIVTELWRWVSLPESERSDLVASTSIFCTQLEFFLCGAFHQAKSTRRQGWWCDGVAIDSLAPIGDRGFELIGAACWAKGGKNSPFFLAPLEMEFHFREIGDREAERIVIRFGSLDPSGQIRKTPWNGD